jgi:hypothetical protein
MIRILSYDRMGNQTNHLILATLSSFVLKKLIATEADPECMQLASP